MYGIRIRRGYGLESHWGRWFRFWLSSRGRFLLLRLLLGLQAGVGLTRPIESVLINVRGPLSGLRRGRGGGYRRLLLGRGLSGLFRLGFLGVLRCRAAIEPVVNHAVSQLLAGAFVKRRSTPLIIRRPCSSL